MTDYKKIRDELLEKQNKQRLDDEEFFTLSRLESYLQAIEYNMKYFIYQGGIREKTLDFCKIRNNKVFSIDELITWKEDPNRPSIKDYDPILHLGSNKCFEGESFCYHSLGFISNECAKELRPEIDEQGSITKIELSNSLTEDKKRIIEQKRFELLSQVDPSSEMAVNYLINQFANEVIAKNDPIIIEGREITVEQAIDEISPKILQVANLISKGTNGLFNIKGTAE